MTKGGHAGEYAQSSIGNHVSPFADLAASHILSSLASVYGEESDSILDKPHRNGSRLVHATTAKISHLSALHLLSISLHWPQLFAYLASEHLPQPFVIAEY